MTKKAKPVAKKDDSAKDGVLEPRRGGTCCDQRDPDLIHHIMGVTASSITLEIDEEEQTVRTVLLRSHFTKHWVVLS